MSNFETPINFDKTKRFRDLHIEYLDLMEISQGGPEVGRLSINGTEIKSHFFGGPLLVKNGYLFAPIYVKKFFGHGFKLCKLNLNSLKLELLGNSKDLIFLDKIIDNEIFFFEDLNKTIVTKYNLNS